jgi:hypothetical protein
MLEAVHSLCKNESVLAHPQRCVIHNKFFALFLVFRETVRTTRVLRA